MEWWPLFLGPGGPDPEGVLGMSVLASVVVSGPVPDEVSGEEGEDDKEENMDGLHGFHYIKFVRPRIDKT